MAYLIVALGAIFITYLILSPKLKKTQAYNVDVEQLNHKILDLQNECDSLTQDKKLIQSNILFLKSQQDDVQNSLNLLKDQAQQSADIFYEQSMQIAEQRLDTDLKLKEDNFNKAQEAIEEEYLQILEDCVNDFQEQIISKKVEMSEVSAELADLRNKLNSAIEQAKRQVEMEQHQDFYKLQLSQLDIQEIARIRSIIPYLRDAEPVNKVIYKVYYEKPYTDLVGRVIGSGVHTGIYKITNTQNQMCYVGQSVNLSDRWKQHIRRGVGADVPTRNKLYPAMLEIGPENFTFEVLEECPKDKLDEREQYWQEYCGAKTWGYSIK